RSGADDRADRSTPAATERAADHTAKNAADDGAADRILRRRFLDRHADREDQKRREREFRYHVGSPDLFFLTNHHPRPTLAASLAQVKPSARPFFRYSWGVLPGCRQVWPISRLQNRAPSLMASRPFQIRPVRKPWPCVFRDCRTWPSSSG